MYNDVNVMHTNTMCMYNTCIMYIYIESYKQVLMMVVISNQRLTGVRSSGLPFLLWMVMSFYGALKLRTLLLVAEDAVRV